MPVHAIECAIGACLVSVSVAVIYIAYGISINVSASLRAMLQSPKSPLRHFSTALQAVSSPSHDAASAETIPGAAHPLPRQSFAVPAAARPSAGDAAEARRLTEAGDFGSRILLGTVVGGLVCRVLFMEFCFDEHMRGAGVVVYLCVGAVMSVGAQLGGGDLTGHLLCGLPRRSNRSLVFVTVALGMAAAVNFAASARYVEGTTGGGVAPPTHELFEAALQRGAGQQLLGAGAAAGVPAVVSYAQHPQSAGGFVLDLTNADWRRVAAAVSVSGSGFVWVLWCIQPTAAAHYQTHVLPVITSAMVTVGLALCGWLQQSKTLGLLNVAPVLLHHIAALLDLPLALASTAVSASRVDASLLSLVAFVVLPNVAFYALTRQHLRRPFFASRFVGGGAHEDVTSHMVLGAALFGIGYGALGLDVSAMLIGAGATWKPQFVFAAVGVVLGERLYHVTSGWCARPPK